MTKVAPSILSADYSRLGKAVKQLSVWGADYVHFDVMDGSFVPAITFGAGMLKAVRPLSELVMDVHLMVEHPITHIDDFIKAGADILTVHVEADRHIHRTVQLIKQAGVKAGVALNPGTPVSAVEAILPDCDLVLVMSVNPGAGGQRFINTSLKKISELRKIINKNDYNCEIEVDGGINSETAKTAVNAGVDVLVSGSSIFSAENPQSLVNTLKLLKR